MALSLPQCSVLRKIIQPGQQTSPHPRALQLDGKSSTLESFPSVSLCQVQEFSPSSLESCSSMRQGRRDEEVNQPSRWSCCSARSVLREAPRPNWLQGGKLAYAAEIFTSIPSKLMLIMGTIQLFKSMCLIWHNWSSISIQPLYRLFKPTNYILVA